MTATQADAIHADAHIVLQPVLYADIFDFPLTFEEIYNFVELKATPAEVSLWLKQAVQSHQLAKNHDHYFLPGRDHLVALRQARQSIAWHLWPLAEKYGQRIAALPFVTMVAVTGSLAVNNPRSATDDIDLLIVTRPGRLWLCRALIIVLVRLAHRRGVNLCPNFLITENALNFEQNLFVAREILQMKPIYGQQPYRFIFARNGWVNRYFPQATASPPLPAGDELAFWQRFIKSAGQFLLAGFLGNWLEHHLRHYQISKHTRLAARLNALDTTIFTADVCKGHYNGHGQRTLARYQERLNSMASPNGVHLNGKQGGK